jgi:hypothetical protein
MIQHSFPTASLIASRVLLGRGLRRVASVTVVVIAVVTAVVAAAVECLFYSVRPSVPELSGAG